ncbi:unnamed protein product [Caenorhabditis nigoni]
MESVRIAMINYYFLTFLMNLMFSVIVTPYCLAPSFIASAVGIFEQLGVDPILQLGFLAISIESFWNYATILLFSHPIYLAAPENPKLSKSEISEQVLKDQTLPLLDLFEMPDKGSLPYVTLGF